ncbi:MAG: hydroxymethylbilane synthase [Chloroflexota bacterium]|jgi:hydroxymethylbilane synthase|nr:hydroxymethylbilane synthase [Chloroflexota bacterium]
MSPDGTSALRLGTRGSPLALAQAELVRRAYLDRFPDREVEVVTLKTQGDREGERALDSFSAQGVFVKEIEERLVAGDIDAAVHSAKDLAVEETEGLEVLAYLERESPYDVVIRPRSEQLGHGVMPQAGERVATDSTRRRRQLEENWKGVDFVDIRGNIETRLRKLEAGDADALVLAAAGLRRLGLNPKGEHPLAPTECVPAPGQGALAVQVRMDDARSSDLRWLNHFPTSLAVSCERDLATAIGAGCSVPLGVLVEFRGGETQLRAALHDGDRLYRVEARSIASDPQSAVSDALRQLREAGASWEARK